MSVLNTFRNEWHDCEGCAWHSDDPDNGRPICHLNGYYADNMNAACEGPWTEYRKKLYINNGNRKKK